MCVRVWWQLLELPHFHLNGLISLVLLNSCSRRIQKCCPLLEGDNIWLKIRDFLSTQSPHAQTRGPCVKELLSMSLKVSLSALQVQWVMVLCLCVEEKSEAHWAMAGPRANPITITILNSYREKRIALGFRFGQTVNRCNSKITLSSPHLMAKWSKIFETSGHPTQSQ